MRRKGEEKFGAASSSDLFMSVSSIQGSIYLQDEFPEHNSIKQNQAVKKRYYKTTVPRLHLKSRAVKTQPFCCWSKKEIIKLIANYPSLYS